MKAKKQLLQSLIVLSSVIALTGCTEKQDEKVQEAESKCVRFCWA